MASAVQQFALRWHYQHHTQRLRKGSGYGHTIFEYFDVDCRVLKLRSPVEIKQWEVTMGLQTANLPPQVEAAATAAEKIRVQDIPQVARPKTRIRENRVQARMKSYMASAMD